MKVEREQSLLRHLYLCLPSVELPCLTTFVQLQAGHRMGSKTMLKLIHQALILSLLNPQVYNITLSV